ncbi:MAG: WYL domain-containing protein [Filomicrobium sp.]
MQDLNKVRRNVRRMLKAGAPDEDLEMYLYIEGITIDQLVGTKALPKSDYEEMAEAMEDKTLLKIDYPPGERIVEPYALGRTSQGNEVLRAYQRSGASESGEPTNWKLFRVDRIDDVEPVDRRFRTRNSYKKKDRAMRKGIIDQVGK